jgi:hypothetical protein
VAELTLRELLENGKIEANYVDRPLIGPRALTPLQSDYTRTHIWSNSNSLQNTLDIKIIRLIVCESSTHCIPSPCSSVAVTATVLINEFNLSLRAF